MKVRKFIGVMAVAGLGLAPQAALAQSSSTAGSTTAGSTTAKADDSTLKSRIETRLKNDAALKADDIDVDVDNGVVTLTGTVHSAAQSTQAGTLAKVPGVTTVNNKLTVDSKTTRAIDKAGDKTDEAMDKAGDKADKTMDTAAAKTVKATDKAAAKRIRPLTRPPPRPTRPPTRRSQNRPRCPRGRQHRAEGWQRDRKGARESRHQSRR